jgi:hypothetical protein
LNRKQFVKSILIAISGVILAACGHAPARQPLPSHQGGSPAQVLILGTHHFGGSTDYMGSVAEDIMTPRRQREVEALVEVLETFRPTRIAVEVPLSSDSALNVNYRRYLAGERQLGRSEDEQIGFRLAARLNHSRIYAIDYPLDEDMSGVVAYAVDHDDYQFLAYVKEFAQRMQAASDSVPDLPLAEALRRQNTAEYDALHSAYLRMAQVGAGASYIGADVVAARYERNLKIFANLTRIAAPGDRILVIYGASHGKLLRDFAREAELFELVDVLPYLRTR